MSAFPPAFSFLMDNEDRLRKFAVFRDRCPEGCSGPCFAISGINSGAWPRQFAAIQALPQKMRGGAIANFYESVFWNPMHFAQIDSQDLANRVMDCAVNEGANTSVEILQESANALLGATVPRLRVDGLLGPFTLTAVNYCALGAILNEFRQQRVARYKALAAKDPDLAKDLAGFEARALA